MKIYVGVTDFDWFHSLKQANCDEVNIWKPGGKINFKALDEGEMFLFKLYSPRNIIVGGNFFLKFSIFCRHQWSGKHSGLQMVPRAYKRNGFYESKANIGCIMLSMPFYFDEQDWIPVPDNWKGPTVQGNLYDTTEPEGLLL